MAQPVVSAFGSSHNPRVVGSLLRGSLPVNLVLAETSSASKALKVVDLKALCMGHYSRVSFLKSRD